MKHDSRYGTTCWFCGHAGLRTKTINKVVYQACDDCKLAQGSRDSIREARNADVEGMKFALRGFYYAPAYWTPARFENLCKEYGSLPLHVLNTLKWIDYADPFMEATKARVVKGRNQYHKEYYAKLRKQQQADTAAKAAQYLKELKHD